MATHSSTLAWKIPWTEEPGRLQSVGSLRVGHDWATSLSLFTFLRWRRKRQPTPVFLPGKSQGRGNLVGCRLWGLRVWHDWSDLAAAAPDFSNGTLEAAIYYCKNLKEKLLQILLFYFQPKYHKILRNYFSLLFQGPTTEVHHHPKWWSKERKSLHIWEMNSNKKREIRIPRMTGKGGFK